MQAVPPIDTSKLLNRLKLRQLVLLLEIEATGNLHRAAERIHLSQPSASKLLQEVESALGATLFERTQRGMVPTAFGTLAARYARLMLTDLSNLRQELDGLKTGLSGQVRIGAIVAAVPDLVAPVLAGIATDHPGIGVSLVTDTSDALLAGLRSGRLDLMIGRMLGADGQAGPSGLTRVTLGPERLRVVAGPDWSAERAVGALSDLAKAGWILQAAPSPMRRAIEAAFTVAQLPVPAPRIEASSVLATVMLLRRTALLAVLPASVSRPYAAAGMLSELPVKIPDLLGPYALISDAGRPQSPTVAQVARLILARAIGNPDRPVPTAS
jgi:DNA-binding transcriptional LysR family regulator